MKNQILLLITLVLLSSCAVTESVTFNEDGSGEFLVSYDMGMFMAAMKSEMGGGVSSNPEKKGKVIDSTIVFNDVMEKYADSVATLSKEKQEAIKAMKNMFMNIEMNEDDNKMNMGIGLKFNSIEDLKDIGEKIAQAKKLSGTDSQSEVMKNTPIGKFMGDKSSQTDYTFNSSTFTRITTLSEDYNPNEMETLFDVNDEDDQEIKEKFSEATYQVKLSFPKPIKTINVDQPEFSKDRKQVSYKVSWIEYLKNPKVLDLKVTFIDE